MSALPRIGLAVAAVSGFCSLVYQVVWERTLRSSVGGDSVAAAIVTGTFLLGLGLGAFVFGRRHRRPFAVYALIEAGIGVYGALAYHVLSPLARVLAAVFPAAIEDASGLRPVVVVVAVLFLLPPCILIGGTGPLLFDCFVGSGAYPGRAVGLLYGANTLGAGLGVLVGPFLLLNRLSLPATLAVIAGVNVLLAAAIWRTRPIGAGERADNLAPGPGSFQTPASASARPPANLLGLAFLSGSVVLAFELCLVRLLFLLNPSSPYNFPLMLVVVLLALSAGSVVFTWSAPDSGRAALRRTGWLFSGAAVLMLASLLASALLWTRGMAPTRLAAPGDAAALAVHAVLLGSALPLLQGGVLPVLLRAAAPTGQALPGRAGAIYLVNAAGAFTGALGAQFVAIPTLGLRGTLLTLYLVGLGVGATCLWQTRPAGVRAVRALALLAALAVAPALGGLAPWSALVTPGPADASRLAVDVVEGVTGVAAIAWGAGGGEVFVNGQSMSHLPDHPRHVRLVSFALSLPRRERVLLLGLGGGGMVRALVQDPGIRVVEVVDWSHELPRLLDAPRPRDLLGDALHDPKVRLCRCDARVAVSLYPSGVFDVVIDNLTIGHWVGATSVKSVEYFREVRRLLPPSGVFVYHGNYGGARRAILAGLLETFPVVWLHAGRDRTEEVVLAANEPIALRDARVAQVLEALGAGNGVVSAHDLVAGLTPLGRADVRRARPVRDAYLVHEYHRDPVRWLKQRLRRAMGPAPGR